MAESGKWRGATWRASLSRASHSEYCGSLEFEQDNCCPKGLLGSKQWHKAFDENPGLGVSKRRVGVLFKYSNGNRMLLGFAILYSLLLMGCSQAPEEQSNEISGNVPLKIYQACEYPNGTFCDLECCSVNEKCGDEEFSYKRCNLETGEWEIENYIDNECVASCKNISLKQKKEALSCSEGFICKDYYHRAYQSSDCSIKQEQYCEKGCESGSCNTICKPGALICGDKVLRVCDSSGNTWLNKEICEFGCKDGKCLNNTNAQLTNITDGQQNQTTNQTQNTTQSPQNICGSSCFSINNFSYDPEGNECQAAFLNGEYVKFKNSCGYSCGLTGWTISDDKDHTYVFPSFTINPQAEFTLYSGAGTNSESQLYWNSPFYPCKAIWNNDGDILTLKNQNNEIILTYTYP